MKNIMNTIKNLDHKEFLQQHLLNRARAIKGVCCSQSPVQDVKDAETCWKEI